MFIFYKLCFEGDEIKTEFPLRGKELERSHEQVM